MFGHFRHSRHGEAREALWAISRHMRGRFGGRHGGRFGGGDDEQFRAGRMLVQGDLRLVALALIAEAPRHGYELIKQIEEKTEGWYAPSPGVIYPTLTFLEETGFVTSEADGNKKLYTITEAGRAHLEENRALADAILARFARIGAKAERFRRHERGEREEGRHGRGEDLRLPRGVEAAMLNLRETIARRLQKDEAAATDMVELLVKAAREAGGQ